MIALEDHKACIPRIASNDKGTKSRLGKCDAAAAPDVPVVGEAVAPVAEVAGSPEPEVVEGRPRFAVVACAVGIVPPLAILDVDAAAETTGVGLGMFVGSLYMVALAGVVTFVVVLR